MFDSKGKSGEQDLSQPAFTCSKSKIRKLEKVVKSVLVFIANALLGFSVIDFEQVNDFRAVKCFRENTSS